VPTPVKNSDFEDRPFPPKRDYSSLSVKDLLDARDAYHVHLSHLANVVATAIGRYRIRHDDWYAEHPAGERPTDKTVTHPTYPRTLYNSVIRPWSWPCVLVFVRGWVDRSDFGTGQKEIEPDQMVPGALFMPDGRVIPTCVIQVEEGSAAEGEAKSLSFPRGIIGGGYLLASDDQRRTQLGSVGCLVTDGNSTYALTNRHVTGEEGREIFSIMRGQSVRVGVSSKKQLGKEAFSKVYPGWSGTNVMSNLDAGLVRVDDLRQWTTQVVGLGSLDTPIDLTTDNITLDLIDKPVRAFGGASGLLLGKIDGLFYRYKSMGGNDYVADFLIGPRLTATSPGPGSIEPKEMRTLPGDSGTLWCFEQADQVAKTPRLRPIALQWGGHVFSEGGQRRASHAYALATCLSTICRELDVDVLRDWNSGLPEYWGDIGHYTVAALACQSVQGDQIEKLMKNNLTRISYEEADLRPANFKGLSKKEFVPLADVPDKVWKTFGDGRRGQSEHPNHFADMDKKGPDSRTLLDICLEDGKVNPAMVDVGVWQSYYSSVKDKSRGCLPFRVWQIYDAMVEALGKPSIPEFVCAAGLLAHYVGDACQPLHISAMFDGDPSDPAPDSDTPKAKGVHSAYETKMLNKHFDKLIPGIKEAVDSGRVKKPEHVKGGHAAAVAVVELMQETFHTLRPEKIIEAFVGDEDLWEKFGAATIDLIAHGSLTLASLWESAWLEGLKGKKVPVGDLEAVSMEELSELYLKPEFLPSLTLNDLANALVSEPVG
jgi:hypothetical protein